MANGKGKRRKRKQDLPERAQACLSLLSASLLSTGELLKLVEVILRAIR